MDNALIYLEQNKVGTKTDQKTPPKGSAKTGVQAS